MISVRDVHKSFGSHKAVAGVSFDLQPGQVVGLLGPNGAGKTTTIRMIAGYLPPDRGRVSVMGHDSLEDPIPARRALGYLPESAPLYHEMKVREYLDYRASLYGMPRIIRRPAVEAVMERCWIADVRSKRIGKLSKGYKQRVGLAAALVHSPAALILDEPTNGLDPTQIRETRQLIRDLAKGRTLLISSHILPEIERLCDRVLVVCAGKLKADGTPSELLAQANSADRYIVQCRRITSADDARVQQTLANVPFVATSFLDPAEKLALATGWAQWVITAKPGATDLREAIATACSSAGLVVRELRREAVSLEHIFLRLIEEQPGTDTTPGGSA